MKSGYLSAVTVLLAILSASWVHDFQEDQAAAKAKTELADRIDLLEKRTELLEQILFSSVKLETTRAQRALEDRKAQLRNSKKLFAKGLVTRFQLEQEQLRVNTAQRELQLASSTTNQRQLVCELELLEAQRQLKVANEELTYQRTLARRGFASQLEVEGVERWVDEATQVLNQAKVKLEAAKKFEALQSKPPAKIPDGTEKGAPKK